jgi:hypothetical protein
MVIIKTHLYADESVFRYFFRYYDELTDLH